MWKKILIPFVFLGLSSAGAGSYDVEAEPGNVFVGVELSGAMVQSTVGGVADVSTNGMGYGMRLGAQNKEWRTMITLDRYNNGGALFTRSELHIDYLFNIMQLQDAGLKPFLGFKGGYAVYEEASVGKAKGYTYGTEAGIVFDLSEHIDIDLSYQYGLHQTADLSSVSQLTLGVNYKY